MHRLLVELVSPVGDLIDWMRCLSRIRAPLFYAVLVLRTVNFCENSYWVNFFFNSHALLRFMAWF
jgi:hypothetical protein